MKNTLLNIFINIGCPSLFAVFIVGVIKKIADKGFDSFWDWCKNISFDFCWKPDLPLTNTNAKSFIKDYPKDRKIEYKKNEERINGWVEGENAFIQRLSRFISTPNDKYEIYPRHYGNEQAETIFTEKNITEFKRQCKYMAENIIKDEIFKDYIQEIYSINRKRGKLYIELKVYGNPKTLKCEICNLLKTNKRKKTNEIKV